MPDEEKKKLLTADQIADLSLVRDTIAAQVKVIDETIGLTVDQCPPGMTAAQVAQATLLMAVGGIELFKMMILQMAEEFARPKRPNVKQILDEAMARLRAEADARPEPQPKCPICRDLGSVKEDNGKITPCPGCRTP